RLRPVVGVDADVVVREIAGVDRFAGLAAAQRDAHGDFGFFHDPLAVFFAVVGVALAAAGDQHVAQPEADARNVQVVDAGVADGRQNAPQIRVGGVERGFYQGRVGHGIGDLQRFFGAAGLFDLYGHELG